MTPRLAATLWLVCTLASSLVSVALNCQCSSRQLLLERLGCIFSDDIWLKVGEA